MKFFNRVSALATHRLSAHALRTAASFGTAYLLASATLAADTIKRTPLPNSNFPIALAVTVPADYQLIFLSGALPEPIDGKTAGAATTNYGDTRQQTTSALKRLGALLNAEGLTFADVVQTRVFLVADPALGHVDYSGFNAAYGEFFGSATQPEKPARTALQVVGLAWPGTLIEIEFIAARKTTPSR